MALRFEGGDSWPVAGLTVVMTLGMGWLFGIPSVMTWILAVLLVLGIVVKTGGSSASGDPPDDDPPHKRKGRDIYGPPS